MSQIESRKTACCLASELNDQVSLKKLALSRTLPRDGGDDGEVYDGEQHRGSLVYLYRFIVRARCANKVRTKKLEEE